MFWKLIALTVMVWAVSVFFFSFTLGGLIHVLPVAAVALIVYRRMAKAPNTEFGRWKSAARPPGRE